MMSIPLIPNGNEEQSTFINRWRIQTTSKRFSLQSMTKVLDGFTFTNLINVNYAMCNIQEIK